MYKFLKSALFQMSSCEHLKDQSSVGLNNSLRYRFTVKRMQRSQMLSQNFALATVFNYFSQVQSIWAGIAQLV